MDLPEQGLPAPQHDAQRSAEAAASHAAATDDFEELVSRLRSSYGVALAFARDLPWLGRCVVQTVRANRERELKRFWVARLPTRLYVETHVRAQLEHLVACLRDEMIDPVKEQRWAELVSRLDESTARLAGWKRVKTVVLRLPPIAAALPVFAAAAATPVAELDLRELARAVSGLLVSAAVIYVVIIWPSLRLGFRVKRAIFSGGVDLAYPWRSAPAIAMWEGLSRRRGPPTRDLLRVLGSSFLRLIHRRRGGVPRNRPDLASFPDIHVYRSENLVFAELGRRKRTEMPIDLALSPTLYLGSLTALFLGIGYMYYLATVGIAEDPSVLWFAPVALMLPLVPAQLLLQARANNWCRHKELDERLTQHEVLKGCLDRRTRPTRVDDDWTAGQRPMPPRTK